MVFSFSTIHRYPHRNSTAAAAAASIMVVAVSKEEEEGSFCVCVCRLLFVCVFSVLFRFIVQSYCTRSSTFISKNLVKTRHRHFTWYKIRQLGIVLGNRHFTRHFFEMPRYDGHLKKSSFFLNLLTCGKSLHIISWYDFFGRKVSVISNAVRSSTSFKITVVAIVQGVL